MFKFIRGYVRIQLTGGTPERFLNLCQYQNYVLWDICCEGESCQCNMYLDDFWSVKKFARKSGCHIHILHKYGLPFLLYQNRKRKMYVGGVILAAAILIFLSQFIWEIHIEGNTFYTDETILSFLEEQDIYHGMLSNKVNCDVLEEALRNQYNRITWVTATVSGTRLLITVRENYGLLEVSPPDDEPADLVASEAGRVVSIITRQGIPQVKAGDEVQEGQLLVSGAVPITNDADEIINYQYVHADADVVLESTMHYKDEVDLVQSVKQYTGNQMQEYHLKIGSYSFQIPAIPKNFTDSDMVENQNQLKLFGDFYLPVWWTTVTQREYESSHVWLTQEQAEERIAAREELFLEKLEKNNIEVVENQVRIYYDAFVCHAEGDLIVHRLTGKSAEVSESLTQIEETQDSNEFE